MSAPEVIEAGPPSTHLMRSLVGAYVGEQCRVLLEADAVTLRATEAIHDTRVAARRLRSTLRTFPELFAIPPAGRLDEELRWWADVLGAVRDLDVIEVRLGVGLDGLPDDLVLGPVRRQLAETVAARRHAARESLSAAADSSRYRDLVALLRSWRLGPPFTTDADRPAKRANRFLRRADKRATKRLRTAYEAAVVSADDADELLHRARKAAKRHRYAAELAEPVLGAKTARIVDRGKSLQDLLGDHQDGVVARAVLRELGATAENGFTWGLLHAREEQAAASVVGALAPYV